MKKSDIIFVATLVAMAVRQDRARLLEMLSKSGVALSPAIPNKELTSVTVDALGNNPGFSAVFHKWAVMQTAKNSHRGFDGSSTMADAPSGSDGGFFSGFSANTVVSLLGTAGSIFGGIKASDANADAIKAQANAQIAAATAAQQNSLTQLEIAKLQLAAAQTKPSGNNTVLYIVLGVTGAAVLGFTIYFVTKK